MKRYRKILFWLGLRDETDLTRDEIDEMWERAEPVSVIFGPSGAFNDQRTFAIPIDVRVQVSVAPDGRSSSNAGIHIISGGPSF